MFDPNEMAVPNGNIFGFPYDYDSAEIVLIPVRWEPTVSYQGGTAFAPKLIREASLQLDFYHPKIDKAWEVPIFMLPEPSMQFKSSLVLRLGAVKYREWLVEGQEEDKKAFYLNTVIKEINKACVLNNDWVYQTAKEGLDAGKLMGVVGGDHSCPLGLLRALGEKYDDFGILQIDAHADLRKAYEDFTYSHASIMYNVLSEVKSVKKLVSVGIRDICQEEVDFIAQSAPRIKVFYDWDIKKVVHYQKKKSWDELCAEIIDALPEKVYISFDIDGLDPKLCPNTGTPVPGGLDFYEAIYLIEKLVESGREIIGFDLCEVGQDEWDANVGARVLYQLCLLSSNRLPTQLYD